MYLRYERRRFLTALIAAFIPGLLLIAGIYILYWIALAQGGTLILSYWLAALPAGLFFGWVRKKEGGIAQPAAAHMAVNILIWIWNALRG